jgi:hypothetical protein
MPFRGQQLRSQRRNPTFIGSGDGIAEIAQQTENLDCGLSVRAKKPGTQRTPFN